MSKDDSQNHSLECDFCSKKQYEVKKLIAGPGVYICNECVDLCHGVLHESTISREKYNLTDIPSPPEIYRYLDQYVVGQDTAKMIVSVAVNNHYKRLANPIIDDVELKKANICLIGPSGSGKTLIVETLAKMLEVPLAIADATSLTEAGYVGDDVESIVTRLLQMCNYDKARAETGIVFIDEIDKKARKSDGGGATRDVSGEGVQQSLLKMIEGDIIRVPPMGGKKNPNQEMIEINTKNILFIVGGAFVNLDKLVDQRLNKNSSSIGFGANIREKGELMNVSDALNAVDSEDLIKYGLIPELVGRLPVIAPLQELNKEQLISVMTEPKNAIVKQYQSLFKLENMKIQFTKEALMAVANEAIKRKTGARAVQSIIETRLIKTQFHLNEYATSGKKEVIVDETVFTEMNEPKVI